MSFSIPQTLVEAETLAAGGGVKFVSGGTDLIVRRSLGLDASPDLIDLSQIPELHGITAEGGVVSIGATTTLAELATNRIVEGMFPVLVEAALSIATPPIRNSATVAGNLLCENRCIYYDQSEFWQAAAGGCLKCGSNVCVATGSAKHCYSVFISDLAPVLLALDAQVEVLSDGALDLLPIESLYSGDGLNSLTISKQTILTRIVIPEPAEEREARVFFQKHRERASIDFTNLTVAIRQTADGVTVAASGIGPAPAILRAVTTDDPQTIASALLKKSRIIDNLTYRRTYRKEMLLETVRRGLEFLAEGHP